MNNMKLWYNTPASRWNEALPIGNGRQGAMVFGSVDLERIQINEDTFWSGYNEDKTRSGIAEHINKVRELMFQDEYGKAQEIVEKNMLCSYQESYEPIGDIYIRDESQVEVDKFGCLPIGDAYQITSYKRELDINTAVTTVEYKINDVEYKRELFASNPDNIIAMKITTNVPKSINIDVFMSSPLRHNVLCENEDVMIMNVKAPSHTDPSYVGWNEHPVIYNDDTESIDSQTRIKVSIQDGLCYATGGAFNIRGASSVVFLISTATSFNGFDKLPVSEGKDASKECIAFLEKASSFTYEELMERHIKDHQKLFNKVELFLGDSVNAKLPTDERIQKVRQGENDPALVSLLFQYGRYLMIASSRNGTQPANLQGIWNEEVRPPWASNYTLNINAQMNYWPVEVCNLSECHEPFLKMVEDFNVSGRNTAKINFDCNGWTANHNSTIWRHTTQIGGFARYAFWPMGGAWCCRHLWEHYLYTKDTEYLKDRAYPVIKGAVEFLLDWMTLDKEGKLVTCPSTSPENSYKGPDGVRYGVTIGSAMDLSIIGEILDYCYKATKILNIEDEFSKKVFDAKNNLKPLQIGSDGTLLEWNKEFDEFEPGHRHVSHLYGIYPGYIITKDQTKELFEAGRKSLIKRLENGGGHTGWSCAWIINLWARFLDGEMAYKYVQTLITKSIYTNLFDAHPPFQIDGNFGATSGIAEMLLQSHTDEIELLPAIPSVWSDGSVKGLIARGGFELDFKWSNGNITKITVKSKQGGICRIKYSAMLKIQNRLGEDISYENENGVISFATTKQGQYEIY